ncbi:MAG: hypothetical protein DI536_22390 [Archangium gephyra]|uniref:Metallo-beta-lactamase domain-containing protein n=1 Tax=Archangium gephyra TaxID=48 RepID=A0A2W5T8K9_9BACT|nr:MAG: hypothetical protein DI536_22390 [Archangium gephyra]
MHHSHIHAANVAACTHAGGMNRLIPLLMLAGCSSLPSPAPHAFVTPPRPTTDLTVCWIDTGGLSAPGSYGSGGTPTAEKWEVTSAALLVRHPGGDVLIDTGVSPSASEDARDLSAWKRFVFDNTAGRNVARESLVETLATLGVTKLKAVILSHAHPDHAGGLTALPEVPVWLAAEEKAFVDSGNQAVVPAHVKALTGRMEPLVFEPVPYANYDARADVFGDGSLVVVPAFGHTPGSVVTFVNTPTLRVAHVGDLINLGESLNRKVQKSFLMRTLTDEDEAANDAQDAKLIQLHEADPEVVILPAHDRPRWAATLPKCTAPGKF